MGTRRAGSWDGAMRVALEQASRGRAAGDIPVGAALVGPDGHVIATAHNRRELDADPTAHAEMLVLREAAARAGTWRLEGHTLVVTLEPCPMCAMAAVWARLETIVYGAPDPKAGGVWSLYNIPQDERLNHRCEVVAGVLESECRHLLGGFFEERRTAR